MNEARELLKRVMQDIADMSRNYDISQELWTDIRTYLNQSEIPTGCNQETAKDEAVYQVSGEISSWRDVSEEYFRLFGRGHSEARILYLHPAKTEKKPMTPTEIDCAVLKLESDSNGRMISDGSFAEGIRFAEKHHGIGEQK